MFTRCLSACHAGANWYGINTIKLGTCLAPEVKTLPGTREYRLFTSFNSRATLSRLRTHVFKKYWDAYDSLDKHEIRRLKIVGSFGNSSRFFPPSVSIRQVNLTRIQIVESENYFINDEQSGFPFNSRDEIHNVTLRRVFKWKLFVWKLMKDMIDMYIHFVLCSINKIVIINIIINYYYIIFCSIALYH